MRNRVLAAHVLPLERARDLRAIAVSLQTIVFIDDFAGTGRTIVRGLERELDLLRRAGRESIDAVVVCLVGFSSARARIERFASSRKVKVRVYFCEELGPEHSAFSESSTVFAHHAERMEARRVAESVGVSLERRQPLGYGGMEALVVFPEACPNNTLPILWSEAGKWRPLFPRF